MRVVVIPESEAGQVQRGASVVDQFHPVARRTAVRLDFVDPDRNSAVIGSSPGRTGGGRQGPRRVRAPSVGGDGVGGPRV